jgi:hypothetical protein
VAESTGLFRTAEAVGIEFTSLHSKSRKRNDVAPPPSSNWSLLEPSNLLPRPWIRMPPSPLRPRLIQLNLKGRIGRTEILLWVGHVSGGTTELAQLMVGHLSQAFADSFYVFRIGLNHVSSREETGTQDSMVLADTVPLGQGLALVPKRDYQAGKRNKEIV